MDGDGYKGKAFAWDEDGETPSPKAASFDPVAVMRAIEDEDDAPSRPRGQAAAEPDLGAALRAAFAYAEAPAKDEEEEEEDVAREDDLSGEDVATSEAEDWAEEDEEDLHLAAEDDGSDDAGADAWVDEDEATEADAWVEEDEAPAHTVEADFPTQDWPEDDEDATAYPAPALAPAFPPIDALDGPGRKPRIALMGEFSAGKSTLSNFLIGGAALPMKVTATQLPPVWISWGDGTPYREDLEGDTHPIDLARLSEIDPADTRVIRIFRKSEILELCDIIDMPGISDPNMASEVWERVIGKADAVIWCTHATQAWRQSEASVWESLDDKLRARSLLLVTRFDKLVTDSDRARVMRRVEHETDGLFAARLPISLTAALAAGDDPELLERSGAAGFRARLLDILDGLARDAGLGDRDAARQRTDETLRRDGMVVPLEGARAPRGITPSRILPRRIRPVSETADPRPAPGDRDTIL